MRFSIVLPATILLAACSSIGPGTVPRDRADYSSAIGDSWKQQTLLNIVRLRYADFPIFMEISQVIAGYQFQTAVGAGASVQNYISSSVGVVPPAVAGSVTAGATYIDRPTVIYAPLTGTDFIKKLMAPIPPAAVLFLLQSGYSANLVMPLAVDSVNGIANESRRAQMRRPADPQFVRLTQLLYELQIANALQIRIERSKDQETSVMGFPALSPAPELAGKVAEVRRILRLSPHTAGYSVHYGGYTGKGDGIALQTRSMLQIMLELGVMAQVPDADVAGGRATPGATAVRPGDADRAAALEIHSGPSAPADAHVAVSYKGRWFWVADNDVHSKGVFGAIMLLFSISDVGVRTAPPVVTVPAN